MKKQELLKYFNDELLDKLFGFCYARTNDSYEAEDLCSDIIYALVKSAQMDGEIQSVYAFIWKIARNTYADFANKKRRDSDMRYNGDVEAVLLLVAEDEEDDDNSEELLKAVYRRIAFLTKAYRDVMIMFYIDGLSTAEIAKRQCTSEGAVRQRLFAAREKIKREVNEMTETYNKPISLGEIYYSMMGNGMPDWGDPRDFCTRLFSRHVVWLCRKKPMSASEIAKDLNVPTVYVEEELEILTRGANGQYGALRHMDNGKYAINIVLLDKETIEEAHNVYKEQLPKICDIILDFTEKHKDEYLSFPYLNKKVDMNLIIWQQLFTMSHAFSENVNRILEEKYFAGIKQVDRPFSVYGHEYIGVHHAFGWNGADGNNICGYSFVRFENIYNGSSELMMQPHFRYGHNISMDPQLMITLRSINGLSVDSLSKDEKEHAAKAIELGYLYREGDMLYTKILTCTRKDRNRLFDLSKTLQSGFFEAEASVVAEKIAALIKKSIPDYLYGEWRFANELANIPIVYGVCGLLKERGVITLPEDGVGAEGCWLSVE